MPFGNILKFYSSILCACFVKFTLSYFYLTSIIFVSRIFYTITFAHCCLHLVKVLIFMSILYSEIYWILQFVFENIFHDSLT
jgi:hypothetical protein